MCTVCLFLEAMLQLVLQYARIRMMFMGAFGLKAREGMGCVELSHQEDIESWTLRGKQREKTMCLTFSHRKCLVDLRAAWSGVL